MLQSTIRIVSVCIRMLLDFSAVFGAVSVSFIVGSVVSHCFRAHLRSIINRCCLVPNLTYFISALLILSTSISPIRVICVQLLFPGFDNSKIYQYFLLSLQRQSARLLNDV